MRLPGDVPLTLDARLAMLTDVDPSVDINASTATAMKDKLKRVLMKPPEVA
jgi:hypothetical protein